MAAITLSRSSKEPSTAKNTDEIWRETEVKDFPRLEKGPWDLLKLALEQALKGR